MGQAVEFADHERVTAADGGHRLSEPWSGSAGASETVVDVDVFCLDTEGEEPVVLSGEVLLGGGGPGQDTERLVHTPWCAERSSVRGVWRLAARRGTMRATISARQPSR